MKISINLANHRYPNQRALKSLFSGVILLLIFVLAMQGNAYLENRQQALQYQAHLKSLQKQLHGELPKRLTPEELAEQRQVYEQAKKLLQRDSFHWTALFDRMERLLPSGVSLRSFNPDYDKNILLIQGVAKSLNRLQTLLDNLQADQFGQVYLKNQSEIEVSNGRGGKRPALSFSITLEGIF